jgi:hypothetical protein
MLVPVFDKNQDGVIALFKIFNFDQESGQNQQEEARV